MFSSKAAIISDCRFMSIWFCWKINDVLLTASPRLRCLHSPELPSCAAPVPAVSVSPSPAWLSQPRWLEDLEDKQYVMTTLWLSLRTTDWLTWTGCRGHGGGGGHRGRGGRQADWRGRGHRGRAGGRHWHRGGRLAGGEESSAGLRTGEVRSHCHSERY